jgi:hypothetical protein
VRPGRGKPDMKSLSFSGWGSGQTAASCGLVALLWLGLTLALPAAPEPAAASGPTHSVTLQYHEQAGISVAGAGLSFAVQSAPFNKEPTFAKRSVVRGVLKFGNSADQFVGLVWDYTEHKLYLDLNRNRDLTDDGVRVSEHRNDGGNYYYQTFTNLLFSFKTPMGEHRVLADLHLYNYGHEPSASASVRSFWEGKISLDGQEWQIGLVETSVFLNRPGSADGGYLLLRPWEQRQRPVQMEDGALEGVHFCRHLFFGRQSYQVGCTYIQEAGAPAYRLELKEQPAALGELKLTGKFIQRLVLTAGRQGETSAVVLDTPGPVERVPVGNYEAKVYLRQGKAEAHPSSSRQFPDTPRVVVSATRPEVLAMGGPLTNTVSVTPHGRDLYLSYSLVGAGGTTYQLGGPRVRPGFAVYQAGKKVSSGQFEFG